MGYRVKATTGLGAAVSVVVATPTAALAKFNEYRDDGFGSLSLADLDGNAMTVEELAALVGPLADSK